MRKIRFLLAASVVIATVGSLGASQASPCQGTRTAAGSCKGVEGDIQCGSGGQLPIQAGSLRIYANNPSDGPEFEACNDTGPPNTQGRLVVRTSRTNQGARVSLDTDDGQPFPPGYINVQVSPTAPGVWCNKDGDPASASDGYRRPWNSPGTDGGLNQSAVNCAPDLPV